MLLVERAPEQKIISSDEGSRINGILRELITLSGAEIAMLVRTEGALIALAQKVQTNEIECVGVLSSLICGAAQAIADSLGTSLSYIHQHDDKKDVLFSTD